MTDIESVKNAQRLHHILQAVQRIHRSVGELSYEMFMADEDKQGNVVRCLEIIGEAANHVSEEICTANPEIPWAAIIGMRNNLIHGYNEVNYSLVWATVQNDLKVLEERIPQIIDSLNMPSDFKFDQSAGENGNFDFGPTTGGEDFAFFINAAPDQMGAICLFGVRNEEKDCCHEHHSPKFKIDEDALLNAAALYCQVAADFNKS